MIQDINPKIFNNSFQECQPDENSFAVIIGEGSVYLKEDESGIAFPYVKDIDISNCNLIYLFSVDNDKYFYVESADKDMIKEAGYSDIIMPALYRKRPSDKAFAAVTAYQISAWYRSNRYCGRCGQPMQRSTKERMMHCDKCKISLYPRLCPVAIVGIRNKDELLLTKYAGREMPFYALIAGFAEVGESIEGTVRREVFEEVGLKVKNISYFASQPWAMSESLLFGFFCDVDGDPTVTIDEKELSTAVWMKREDVPKTQDTLSLTSYMMNAFAEGRV